MDNENNVSLLNEKNVALLIDADNVSAKYIKIIIDELTSNYGTISVKRAYGDWTTGNLIRWKEVLLDNSLNPIQQFSYTSGKNSTDSAMIIDAMDILYTKDIDIFCLATSDCDFTKIASRLRESGKKVIGMGESKTNKSFVQACNEFKYVDVIFNDDKDDAKKEKIEEEFTPVDDIKAYLFNCINQADGTVQLASLKTLIKSKFSDFDERNYGYSKFSTFINSFSEFIIDNSSIINYVSIKDNGDDKYKEIKNYLIDALSSTKKKCYSSAEIQNVIAKKYKSFKLKNFGYSNMKAFLKSIKELKTDKDGKYFVA